MSELISGNFIAVIRLSPHVISSPLVEWVDSWREGGEGVFSPFDRDVNRANHCHLLQPPAHPIPSHSNPLQSSLWLGHTYNTETSALKNRAKRTNYTDNSVNMSEGREGVLIFFINWRFEGIYPNNCKPTNSSKSNKKSFHSFICTTLTLLHHLYKNRHVKIFLLTLKC